MVLFRGCHDVPRRRRSAERRGVSARKRPSIPAERRAATPTDLPLATSARQRRLALGLTIDAAAERCGVDPRHLQAIEAGATNVMLATLLRLADGLSTDVAGLLAPPKVGQPIPLRGSAKAMGPEAYERALGERVRTRRIQRDWSQRDLAARAGLSLGLVQSVERAAKSATVRSVVLLAAALDLSPRALLADPPAARPARPPPRVARRAN